MKGCPLILLVLFGAEACDSDDAPRPLVTSEEAPEPEKAPVKNEVTEPLPPPHTFDDLVVKEAPRPEGPAPHPSDYNEPLPADLREHLFDMNAQPPPGQQKGSATRGLSKRTSSGSPSALGPMLDGQPSKGSSIEQLLEIDADKKKAIENVIRDYEKSRNLPR